MIKLMIFIFLIFLQACSLSPEAQLIKLLKTKYSNLYVNDEKSKKELIEELQGYLKGHSLDDANLARVNFYLKKLNDGHIEIFDKRPDKNIRYSSGMKFINGSKYIESCETCNPKLINDKYTVLEIDGVTLTEFFNKEYYTVSASTKWGREFRGLRLLEENNHNLIKNLKLRSANGRNIETQLNWKELQAKDPICVTSERLNGKIVKLNILNLWCELKSKKEITRDDIFNNFKQQFNKAISIVEDSDKIVLDLRDNGGGGDLEVEYVINAFYEKSLILYHYKYLTLTHPGKLKWIEMFWPFQLALWAPEEYQYTNLLNGPKKKIVSNRIITLISPGCFSSCETIASILKFDKRSFLLGSNTHGGSGDPVIFPILGTPYSINLPTCITWQNDGHLYEGVGVAPDQELVQNPNTTSDTILDHAIDLIR